MISLACWSKLAPLILLRVTWFLACWTCCPGWFSNFPRAPSVQCLVVEFLPRAAFHFALFHFNFALFGLAFLHHTPAGSFFLNNFCSSPWSLVHHLVKVHRWIWVVNIIITVELPLIKVSSSQCISTGFQIIIITNKSFCTRHKTVDHTVCKGNIILHS